MMKCTKTLRVLMLVGACASTVLARHHRENGCGPLEAGRWGLLGGIGAAPGFFKNRGYSQVVIPRSGLTCAAASTETATCNNIYNILTTPANVFQQNSCQLPKFNDLFTNGVLHVTGQISYNACSNVQYFLEGVYDRATGSCVTRNYNSYQAPDFCSSNNNCSSSSSCSSSCNTTSSSSSSSTSTTPLATLNNVNVNYSNYQAYGGYIGSRYYWNRVWCDRVAFFGGFKFGMLHRKQVCANVTIPQQAGLSIPGVTPTYTFAAQNFSVVPFCKSNAVSGGIQLGMDYCLNDCWSILVGVELVATAPFKSNRNVSVTLPDPTLSAGGAVATGFGRNFPLPTNVLIAPTGSFLQFPVWAGIRWEFDWCKKMCREC